MAISPDGRFVYAGGDGIISLRRRLDTGKLRQRACLGWSERGACPTSRAPTVDDVGRVGEITISPDGRQLYVVAGSVGSDDVDRWAGTVTVVHVNPRTGALRRGECYSWRPVPRCGTAPPIMLGANFASVTTDGGTVVVGSFAGLAFFRRNRATGLLTPTGCIGRAGSVRCPENAKLSGTPAGRFVLTPDGKSIVVPHDVSDAHGRVTGGGLSLLSRNRRTGEPRLEFCVTSNKAPQCALDRQIAGDVPEGFGIVGSTSDAHHVYWTAADGSGRTQILHVDARRKEIRRVGCLGASSADTRCLNLGRELGWLGFAPNGRIALDASYETIQLAERAPRSGQLALVPGRHACSQPPERPVLVPGFPEPMPKPPCRVRRGSREVGNFIFDQTGRHAYVGGQNGIVAYVIR